MKIAIEGPQSTEIDYDEILGIFKAKNRHILI